MDRYMRIAGVTFGQTSLPLPISARLSRSAEARPALSDNDIFTTSVEISPPLLTAEVRIRGTAAAEGLSLGQQGDLSLTVSPTGSGGAPRVITLSGAVLIAVDLTYEQSAMATALLRFVAESSNGQQDPFSAEDAE
jgi:hypothetical protein